MKYITDKKEWDEALKFFDKYDCYHTYDYNYYSKQELEEPVLLLFQNNDTRIAIPFLIRPIPETEYYDATCVWGYGGPISSNIQDDYDHELLEKEMQQIFQDKKIISVFSRLNPFVEHQEELLKNLGHIEEVGVVVNIDLTQDLVTQRANYSKTTKRYVNKYGKQCTVKYSKKEEDILLFIDLFYENMDRVKAKDQYYFSKDYFFGLINSEDFETDVLIAVENETDKIISAAMMIKTKDIIQYHMSGTYNDYLRMTPVRLLIDETRIKGTEEGYTFFNLGGGVGGKDNPLLQFKSSFSKDFKTFNVWKYIVNEEIYNQLCDAKGISRSDAEVDFFPLYRYEG